MVLLSEINTQHMLDRGAFLPVSLSQDNRTFPFSSAFSKMCTIAALNFDPYFPVAATL